jgi:hypothetical protein
VLPATEEALKCFHKAAHVARARDIAAAGGGNTVAALAEFIGQQRGGYRLPLPYGFVTEY